MPCRFAVVSDTHFVAPPNDKSGFWWNRTTESRSDEMGEALVRLMRELAPDFIVHCGDFAGIDAEEHVRFGVSVMERTGCPWFCAPGNHDARSMAARRAFGERFGTGDGTWSYSRDLGGIRFFFLDVVWWLGADGSLSPVLDMDARADGRIIGMGPSTADLLWLDSECARTSLPAIVVTHAPVHFCDAYPLSTLPKGKPAAAPLTRPDDFISGFLTKREGRKRLLDIILNRTAVTACFAGHWHIHDAVALDGVHFIMTGSLRECPYEVRLVEFDGAAFRVETHGLDVPGLREASRMPAWGNAWIEGEPAVRDFSFPLR